jgi:aromatic ring-opening dioxygenase catalytic subunit (LigB family)
LENTGKPGAFYNWLGNYLQNELKPKAIVVISAHWQGEGKDGIFGMFNVLITIKTF